MYEKNRPDWLKHFDFMAVDLLSQQLAFFLSYGIHFGLVFPYRDTEYLNLAVIFILTGVCVAYVAESFSRVLKRGYYKEFVAAVRHVLLVGGVVLVYLFAVQKGHVYSRSFVYVMIPLYILFTYTGRLVWKQRLRKRGVRGSGRSLILVAAEARMDECIRNVCRTGYNTYSFVGAVVTDRDCAGTVFDEVPVVANYSEALDYIRREWVDEVFIAACLGEGYPGDFIGQLERMGMVIHIAITKAGSIMENAQQIERMGNYTVLTTGINCATPLQLWLKRGMDIAGGLVGCLFTAVLFLLVAIPIYSSSPGPIFFRQERVGRNGKKFRLYKFRTMVPGADRQKRELLERNALQSDRMFKLAEDPRIIGGKRRPDGTLKKGIGHFLRETSLDEFPQMFNILRGEMSLVGTRPPTLDEWEKYESHHRARLSFRPGLTGLWQVSGRSGVADFEEVVRLDTKYIDEWSLGLDIKILFKTIAIVLRRQGAL